MCDLKDGFKLCTCDPDSLAKPDWVLQRLDASIAPQHRRGRAMVPHFNEAEQAQQERILTALKDGRCFDFDYVPTEGDVLKLDASGRSFRFRFTDEAWEVDESTSLDGWRAQMVDLDRGAVGYQDMT